MDLERLGCPVSTCYPSGWSCPELGVLNNAATFWEQLYSLGSNLRLCVGSGGSSVSQITPKETPKHISFIVPTWLEITTASSSSDLPGKHSNHPNSSSSLGYQADYRTWERNIFMSCHCPAAQESGIAVCGLFWVPYFTKEKQPLASSERYNTEPTTPNSQYVDLFGVPYLS